MFITNELSPPIIALSGDVNPPFQHNFSTTNSTTIEYLPIPQKSCNRVFPHLMPFANSDLPLPVSTNAWLTR